MDFPQGCANEEYSSFRSSVPKKKLFIDESTSNPWICYESGPKSVSCPLLFLPPVSGKADTYYKQILGLSSKGYRVIAVHIFGASLGGYLAQRFAEGTYHCPRVSSLILCNTFKDTDIFDRHDSSYFYWALPGFLLKRLIMSGFPQDDMEKEIADSVDFMVTSLDSLSQSQLASRLTLNCAKSFCQTQKVKHLPITIIDVFDDCALSFGAREELRNAYPDAKKASLKTGGNFPFLSQSAEVNLHIQIHLRQFENSNQSAVLQENSTGLTP